MTRSISRRTLATGAAWAAPAVMVAGAAPAFAASPPFYVTCPTGTTGPLDYYTSSIDSMRVSAYNTPDGGTTTNYSITFAGGWKVPEAITAADPAITGFILNYGGCYSSCWDATWPSPAGSVTGQNWAGTDFTARVTLTAPSLCEPRLASGGGSTSLTVRTTLPHRPFDYCTNAAARIKQMSIPVTVFYLHGTTAGSPTSNGCCAYLNLTFNNTGCADGTFGYDIDGMSWSSTPLY